MSQIVHITFEKLTGLKGEIEGDFICHPETIDPTIPLILINDELPRLVFEQAEDDFIYMQPANMNQFNNYKEHFKYGTNFLIKSWSYGGGVTINSQPPN